MRNNLIHIFFLIITTTMISCIQTSKKQTDITVKDSELGLVLTKNTRYVLNSGKHRIDKESKVIMFSKIDSLTMDKFDILDLNAKSLFCKIQITYSLTPKNIENIADLLEWVQSIESYKKFLIVPAIRGDIRNITGNYEAVDLRKQDYKGKAQIEKYVSDRLIKYIDLVSLELKIYDKK